MKKYFHCATDLRISHLPLNNIMYKYFFTELPYLSVKKHVYLQVKSKFMQSIHFGAGKIGRGFIGAVLQEAGFKVCFADIFQPIIDLINNEKKYTVHILDEEPSLQIVEGISALHSASEELSILFTKTQLVTTAISMKELPHIAPVIAKGIRCRKERAIEAPLNIISCENGIRATSQLKALVKNILTQEEQEWIEEHIGFADSSVDRIVPISQLENPLDVAVERFYEWNVDKSQLKGTLPHIKGMHLTSTLEAHIERKLFTVNTGHCATAFMGNLKGYTYIHECMEDSDIKAMTRAIMMQSGEALIAKFGFDKKEHEQYVDIVLKRFSNPHIKDLTSRVGHDPKRKLGPTLYFSYPISMALEHGIPTEKLCYAVGAGMAEVVEGDPQCNEIQKLIRKQGLETTITEITGQTDCNVIRQISETYRQLKK